MSKRFFKDKQDMDSYEQKKLFFFIFFLYNVPAMKLLTKKIGILGYGKEGKSLEKFLESRRVRDLKIFDEKDDKFPDFTRISDRDILFRSPGVSPHHPLLQNFRGKIISGTELFLQLCPTKKAIGVTGTKGKGTTSTLIARMFEEANDTVFLLGNIGTPFFDKLPDIRTRDVSVMELSSFQLWDCEQSPQIAVYLRIRPDHMEKHSSFHEYVDAKKNIFLHQKSGGRVVYCADCPVSSEVEDDLPEESIYPVSTAKELEKGAFLRGEDIIWKSEEGIEEVVIRKENIRLRGDYNVENVLAAVATAKLLNVRTPPITTAIEKFSGLPFRLQLVAATKDSIKFWNDSCATVPSATIAGISTFNSPLILIAGGASKKTSYSELGSVIAKNKNIKTVLLIGETSSDIMEETKKSGGGEKIINVKDLSGVFAALKKIVAPGDDVLFSPASASFDQFKNEFERGEKWNEAVNAFLRTKR
jgi:UDP-N-acetylmuramoylalanine--D-glutamate ligase